MLHVKSLLPLHTEREDEPATLSFARQYTPPVCWRAVFNNFLRRGERRMTEVVCHQSEMLVKRSREGQDGIQIMLKTSMLTRWIST